MSVSIGVVSGREGTFRVTCRATGGTLSTSSLTGPGLGGKGLQLQAEGSIGRTGQNTYSVTSDTLSGQSNGDTYTCRAMNNDIVSSLEISDMLAGITGYGSTLYILGIAMVFVFSPYIWKFTSCFQFQVNLTFNDLTAQNMSKVIWVPNISLNYHFLAKL